MDTYDILEQAVILDSIEIVFVLGGERSLKTRASLDTDMGSTSFHHATDFLSNDSDRLWACYGEELETRGHMNCTRAATTANPENRYDQRADIRDVQEDRSSLLVWVAVLDDSMKTIVALEYYSSRKAGPSFLLRQ